MDKTMKKLLIAGGVLFVFSFILGMIMQFAVLDTNAGYELRGNWYYGPVIIGIIAIITFIVASILLMKAYSKGGRKWYWCFNIIAMIAWPFYSMIDLAIFQSSGANTIVILLPVFLLTVIPYICFIVRSGRTTTKPGLTKQEVKQIEGICQYCGAELEKDAKSCTSCGAKRLRAR